MNGKILILAMFFLSLQFVFAVQCSLDATLVNQDPYPAVQGDYVKLVFQLRGVENPECGQVTFGLVEKYPISFDAGSNIPVTINSGTYTKDNSASLMVPYKVRVDSNALDGDNLIEAIFSQNNPRLLNTTYQTKQFNISVKDVRAKFELFVKDYNPMTNMITFEILNTGKSDVQAISLEIPEQENLIVKGSNVNILGDLDSSEYTSTDFEATPKDGNISLNIRYTDESGNRRTSDAVVNFNSHYFTGRATEKKPTSIWTYIVGILIVGGIVFWLHKRHIKKRKHKEMQHHQEHK